MKNTYRLKLYRVKNGLENSITKPWKYPYLYIHLGLTFIILNKIIYFDNGMHLIRQLFKYIIIAVIVLLALISFIDIIIRIGTPLGTKRTHHNLYKIGLKNSVGEIPWLLSKTKLKNKNTVVYIFMNNGISLEEFEKKKEKIEATLNLKVLDIGYVNGRNKIELITTSHDSYETINWKEDYLQDNDFELVLGETMTDTISIDISRIPHILIGGSSGSGKSVLLKLILKQSLNKGAKVYLADFKGGVDFPRVWHEKCNFILTLDELTFTLEQIISVLEARKELFINAQCANIQEYNEQGGALNRIIVACDEIAQILDKTGISKAQKEPILVVEGYLATISQLGRAFGIHLILATQRPDANILNGQIKANIGYRICGRADSVLSSIILDDTSASTMIPKDAQGLFIDQNMKVFQGYWFDDKEL